MSDEFQGIDPEGLRVLGDAATALADEADTVRRRLQQICAAGMLDGGPVSLLGELSGELRELRVVCARRADGIEEAGGLTTTFLEGRLVSSLDDGDGSSGMTVELALATLRARRAELDADGDGAVSHDELAAAGRSNDPALRAAADAVVGVATAEQVEIVNEPAPEEAEAVVGQLVAAVAASGWAKSYQFGVARHDVGDGQVVEGMTVLDVGIPMLDQTWVAGLYRDAPAGTAAIALRYRGEEVHDEYLHDPVPELDELLTFGISTVEVAGLVASKSVPLGPVTIGLWAYQAADLATPLVTRIDSTAVFDVEYRDAEGRLLSEVPDVALERTEVVEPLFSGPGLVVLPG